MKGRFRSKTMREIFRQASEQNFEPGFQDGSGHFSLRCKKKGCGYTQSLSSTMDDGNPQRIQNVVAGLRRHGFVWEGRGGEHTAPLLHRTLRKKRKAS